jgi:hypothetical protein
VNCYPFIEAENAQQRNVKQACGLLKVSRAAFDAARSGQPSDRDHQVSRRSGLRRSPRSPPRPCNAFAAGTHPLSVGVSAPLRPETMG